MTNLDLTLLLDGYKRIAEEAYDALCDALTVYEKDDVSIASGFGLYYRIVKITNELAEKLN